MSVCESECRVQTFEPNIPIYFSNSHKIEHTVYILTHQRKSVSKPDASSTKKDIFYV